MRRDAEAIGRDDGVDGVVVSGHGELEQFSQLQSIIYRCNSSRT